MRGESSGQHDAFSYVSLEERIPKNHPLRTIRERADRALKRLSPLFEEMYAGTGRPSIPPERLLKAQLLIALYSIRSDRQFCESLSWNLLHRWFLGMTMDEPGFVPSSFSKNRERLLEHEVAPRFFAEIVRQAKAEKLLSEEHFTVDGTLIESLASLKSVRRKDDDDDGPIDPDNQGVDFHGERRTNDTHASITDPEARLFRKSRAAATKLYFSGNAVAENRCGLIVDFSVDDILTGERAAALRQLTRRKHRHIKTVAGDKGYCTKDFVATLRERGISPHIAFIDDGRKVPGLDQRTRRHASYALSQRKRKLIEQAFGWVKDIAGLRKSRFFGRAKTELYALMAMSAYNLTRMATLRPLAT
ncbi:MAG TPA: IS5 family transposase [Candidatus Polarisedimenticolia bacterium]|nr:IS5 family transposase [Candidatus Polarisedimenticolia bacterium]